jgi:hypothetical protein
MRGPTIYLADNGTTWRLGMYTVTQEKKDVVGATGATDVSSGAWHLAVFTQSRYFDGQNRVGISLDGANFAYTGLGYWTLSGGPFLDLGWRDQNSSPYVAFDGKMDGLLFADRAWDQDQVNAYYNSGNGAAPPFN